MNQPIERGLQELAELAGPHQIQLNEVTRRIRRRHRARLAAGSATAVALVTACGLVLPNLASGNSSTSPAGPVGADGSKLKSGVADPEPGKLSAEAQQVADLLKQALPPGSVSIFGAQGLHDKGLPSPLGNGLFEPSASAEYDDGHGKALVSVDMTRWTDPDTTKSPFTCAVGSSEPKPDHCQTEHLPGGGVFNLSKIDESKGLWNAEWTATYAAPDGTRVVIQESNAPSGKGVAPTRKEPPFDAARLKQMATSPLWHDQLAAIPAAGSQSRDTNTPFGPDGIGAIFYRLIPAGFARSGFAGADSPVLGNTMVLTDSHGKGSVYNGEDASGTSDPGAVAKFRQDYPHATQLPNGDWLGTKKVTGKGGKGTEQNWAEVLQRHGRITVVATNNVGVNGPRTRSTPVLTIDQLTAIAESPTWVNL